MTLAKARNNTAKQIADVLHLNSEEVHERFASFMCEFMATLHVTNRMYSEQTFRVLDSNITLIRDSYGTAMEYVDLKNNYSKVGQQINAWVEQATQSKIRDLLPPGSVDDLTALSS